MQLLVRRTRIGALVAVVLALVASTVAGVPSAGAADRCDGVWVVVDARALGGELTTRCAPGDPSSGLEALQLAGHSYGFVPRQPGLVCTIDARPDPCNGAPADAYWGYFHAEAGGEWTYADLGAGNRDPEPGTVEGWAFGDDARPGRRPPSNASSEPTPAPSDEPTTDEPTTEEPDPEPTGDPSEAPAPQPDPATERATEPTGDATSESETEPDATDDATSEDAVAPTDPSDAPTDVDTGGGDEVVDAPTGESTAAPLADTTGVEAEESSIAPLVVFALLFLGIGGAAVVRARRRGA